MTESTIPQAGRYSVPTDKVYSTTVILEKGEYTFDIGEPKFFKTMEKDQPEKIRNFGAIVAVTTTFDGKSVTLPIRLYMHNDGSQKMTKRFLMCALGFIPNQKGEQDFNREYPELWVDLDHEELAPVFLRTNGKQVKAAVDVKASRDKDNNETGERQNDFRWQTITA